MLNAGSVHPPNTDLLLFFLLLKPVVRRNLPLGESLRRMVGEGGLPRGLLEAMARELEEGRRLSEVLAARPVIFPQPLPALIAAGEEAGDPSSAVDQCVRLVRRRCRSRRHLQAGLLYPAICLALTLGMLAGQALLDPFGPLRRSFLEAGHGTPASHARPKYFALLSGWDNALAAAGDLFLHNAAARLALGLALASAAVLLWSLFRGPRSVRKDRFLLNLPIAGRLYRHAAAAGFTGALGALLSRGCRLETALAAAIPATGNLWVERELQRRLARVRDEGTLAANLSVPGVFPPSLSWRMALGEERGDLGAALSEAAASSERDLEIEVGRLARTIEPAAIIFVGLVAMVAVSMLLGLQSALLALSNETVVF